MSTIVDYTKKKEMLHRHWPLEGNIKPRETRVEIEHNLMWWETWQGTALEKNRTDVNSAKFYDPAFGRRESPQSWTNRVSIFVGSHARSCCIHQIDEDCNDSPSLRKGEDKTEYPQSDLEVLTMPYLWVLRTREER